MLLAAAGGVRYAWVLHGLLGFDWQIAGSDAVCSLIATGLATWSIILLVRAYPTKVTGYSYALLVALMLSVACVYGMSLLLPFWMKQDFTAQYGKWLRDSLPVRFFLLWLLLSWVGTSVALRKNIDELNSRFQQQAGAGSLLREAELFKLRQQFQPHFLYNSLNSINALILIAPDKAQEMIGKLSDFLRGSLKRESEERLSIAEELNYIQSYLDIESIRFGDRLQVTWQNSYKGDARVPPFLLQPVLENAIKFGLYGVTGRVEILVSIVTEGPMLILSITNPYDPLAVHAKGTGFGLESVGRRLYLLFARTDLLETHKQGNYFTTIVKIPQDYV